MAQDSGAKVSGTDYADAVTIHLVFKAGEQDPGFAQRCASLWLAARKSRSALPSLPSSNDDGRRAFGLIPSTPGRRFFWCRCLLGELLQHVTGDLDGVVDATGAAAERTLVRANALERATDGSRVFLAKTLGDLARQLVGSAPWSWGSPYRRSSQSP